MMQRHHHHLHQQQQQLSSTIKLQAAATGRGRRGSSCTPTTQRLARCMAAAQQQQQQQQQQQLLLVKVCGVTTPEDAEFAAQQGADLIGMIMWPKAKRSVSDATAAAIAAAARRHGAEPVGVFVDEDAATIAARCRAAGVGVAQLHGDGARAALPGIPADLRVVYVLQAADDGRVVTPLPGGSGGGSGGEPGPQGAPRPVDWLLVDGMTGGSGKAFDWTALDVPAGLAARGWLLAGGLGPANVAAAIATARPGGVDVSSGVCCPDGLAKDPTKVAAFVAAAKQASAAMAAL